MIKHLVKGVVNYGEFAAFVEAAQRYEKACSDHGLQTYSLWANNSAGRMNEFFFEATYDDEESLQARDKAENDIPDIMAALKDVIRHCAPGSIYDWRLSTV